MRKFYFVDTLIDLNEDIFYSEDDYLNDIMSSFEEINLQDDIDLLCDSLNENLIVEPMFKELKTNERVSLDYNFGEDYVILRNSRNSMMRCNFIDKTFKLNDYFYFLGIKGYAKISQTKTMIRLMFENI